MSDPRITYEGLNNEPGVDVSYSDLPENTPVAFVDEFGHRIDAGHFSGDGKANMPTGDLVGRYYVSAGPAGNELCQTVNFYLSGSPTDAR